MPEPSSDPPDNTILFSPARTVEREASSDAPFPADTSVSTDYESLHLSETGSKQHEKLACYVSLPYLSETMKAKYQPLAEDSLESDEEFALEEADGVVGEEQDGRYLYIRYSDGVIYKIPARPFEYRHPDLVQDYEEARAKGTLPPFSPTSADVHPSFRQATLTVKLPGLARGRQLKHSLDEYSSDELAQDFDSEGDLTRLVKRRSTRTAAATANKKIGSSLPFSPKKTRSSGRAIVIPSSDSDSDIQEMSQPTRKSTRTRKSRRANLDDDDFGDFMVNNESDSYARAKSAKKVVRGKASRPAYGHFRVVADLQYDEQEYEDISPFIAHRGICEKCHTVPTHEQAKRKKGRRRKKENEDSEDEETRLVRLGGWVRCMKCPVTAHWGCLAQTQRDEILRAAHERDKAEWQRTNPTEPEPRRRLQLDSYQTTEFICTSCMKGGVCMGCKKVALQPDQFVKRAQSTPAQDIGVAQPPAKPTTDLSQATTPAPDSASKEQDDGIPHELLFRCFTCKRLAHYAHLPIPDGYDREDTTAAELATYYQSETGWKCADCASYVYAVEHILAWRPFPEDAIEPPRDQNEAPNYKKVLPREYLIKWADRSYRRVQWVPHGWLLAVAPSKLKNFLLGGTKVALLPEQMSKQQLSAADESELAGFEIGREVSEGMQPPNEETETSPAAASDAEKRIPPAWRTVDRVLDVRLWKPRKSAKGKARKARIESSDEGDGSNSEDSDITKMHNAVYDQGEEPSASTLVTIDEFEALTKEKLSLEHADKVAWAFFKWDDLGYDDASWDSPPRNSDNAYPAFEKAFERFIFARSVTVPKKNAISNKNIRCQTFTAEKQPDIGQSPQLQLMPFQVEGVNWLCHNWNTSQNCILADEMGLGKTVQIVTFIGYVVSAFKRFPALVVVPNSTITNWVREFERWAPRLRVVPFYGEAKAREIIKRFELSHSRPASGTTGAKYHVLITTYETVTNAKEFGPVFKSTPRWEMLVVDEGQRLKSDESLIFKRLKELNTMHRIIMTGTPLNNNIRELFNLMNFLDPDQWDDLERLSKQYEELTDELVTELHGRLKPYFLRRIKSEVLQLPPKNEVIVPVSMAPLQKEIYRSILSQNLDILRSLAEGNASSSKGNTTKTNMNNMLMQLRKCIQHPYLVSDTIEPRGLSPRETHERLIGASAKLRLLKMLLPKLRAREHRVLLFSQFVIALDIVEDFLAGEGIKYLRLDGNTKQADRQKGMDEFNKPDSDVFIYLLTTRAGGVGINLWSADTVIIFDPDFNPHQDLQAIARAHRYGQKKTVLVFKLMVKDSAEERIMQTGKKKLILDHLIVQKMDDETGSKEDVKSILMFGAKALFEENEETVAREVHYSDHDIDNLIEKTEKEGDEVEPDTGAGSLFAFAKVWSADKDGLEDLAEDAIEYSEETDSWAKALELIAARNAKEREKEQTGRGVRRKAAAVFPQQSLHLGDTPTKDKEKEKAKSNKRKKSKGKQTGSDDSDFRAPTDAPSDSDGTVDIMDIDDIHLLPAPGSGSPALPIPKPPLTQGAFSKQTQTGVPHRSLFPIQTVPDVQDDFCGLCDKRHAPGHCSMTESPENLAQYRMMLMQHAGDETVEERRAAIRVIDETLHRLGKMHLIYGQPLILVEKPLPPTVPHPSKKPKLEVGPRPLPQALSTSTVPRNIPKAIQPIAGPSGMNGTATKTIQSATAARIPSAISHPPLSANAVASSSKHPTAPIPPVAVPKPKKVKQAAAQPICPVCGRAPQHLVRDCPVVAQGTFSVAEAIARLAKNPAHAPVVNVLKRILVKQRTRDLVASAAKANPSNSVIDLTDP